MDAYLEAKAAYWSRVDAALAREHAHDDLSVATLDMEPVSVTVRRHARAWSARRKVRVILADISSDRSMLATLEQGQRQQYINAKRAVFRQLCAE